MIFAFGSVLLYAFPVINELSRKDNVFLQLESVVEYNDKCLVSDERMEYEFYSYRCKKDDTIFSISASTGIPYDTISTLNSISNVSENLKNKEIIIPSVKGVFVPLEAKSALDFLVQKEFGGGFEVEWNERLSGGQEIDENENFSGGRGAKGVEKLNGDKVATENENFSGGHGGNLLENANGGHGERFKFFGKDFVFLKGLRFTSEMRVFFLNVGFSLPLDTKVISSNFGYRTSPVYGKWKKHNGIDFAAVTGDNVYACKSGKVAYVFYNDKIFGNYIILSHANGITSVYAHLSKVLVKKNQKVSSREIIGKVGETGATTGPHLHFEIRQDGNATNPVNLLPKM